MSVFASDIKVKYSLDYFHLFRKINETSGYKKFNSKSHKMLYKTDLVVYMANDELIYLVQFLKKILT